MELQRGDTECKSRENYQVLGFQWWNEILKFFHPNRMSRTYMSFYVLLVICIEIYIIILFIQGTINSINFSYNFINLIIIYIAKQYKRAELNETPLINRIRSIIWELLNRNEQLKSFHSDPNVVEPERKAVSSIYASQKLTCTCTSPTSLIDFSRKRWKEVHRACVMT